MHKRIEFVVRNPGYEGTDSAMGSLTIDFQDEQSLAVALSVIASKLLIQYTHPPISIAVENERGESLGLNPLYYVSHRISNVEDWRPTWLLPADGSPPSRHS